MQRARGNTGARPPQGRRARTAGRALAPRHPADRRRSRAQLEAERRARDPGRDRRIRRRRPHHRWHRRDPEGVDTRRARRALPVRGGATRAATRERIRIRESAPRGRRSSRDVAGTLGPPARRPRSSGRVPDRRHRVHIARRVAARSVRSRSPNRSRPSAFTAGVDPRRLGASRPAVRRTHARTRRAVRVARGSPRSTRRPRY